MVATVQKGVHHLGVLTFQVFRRNGQVKNRGSHPIKPRKMAKTIWRPRRKNPPNHGPKWQVPSGLLSPWELRQKRLEKAYQEKREEYKDDVLAVWEDAREGRPVPPAIDLTIHSDEEEVCKEEGKPSPEELKIMKQEQEEGPSGEMEEEEEEEENGLYIWYCDTKKECWIDSRSGERFLIEKDYDLSYYEEKQRERALERAKKKMAYKSAGGPAPKKCLATVFFYKPTYNEVKCFDSNTMVVRVLLSAGHKPFDEEHVVKLFGLGSQKEMVGRSRSMVARKVAPVRKTRLMVKRTRSGRARDTF